MADQGLVGLVYIDGVVTCPSGHQNVTFLIDSGATYSVLPHDVWKALGLARTRTRAFHLADGTRIQRDISECMIELPEIEGEVPRGHTPVILGEPRDVALLGIVTLENLGVVFDPFERSLRLMREAPLMVVG